MKNESINKYKNRDQSKFTRWIIIYTLWYRCSKKLWNSRIIWGSIRPRIGNKEICIFKLIRCIHWRNGSNTETSSLYFFEYLLVIFLDYISKSEYFVFFSFLYSPPGQGLWARDYLRLRKLPRMRLREDARTSATNMFAPMREARRYGLYIQLCHRKVVGHTLLLLAQITLRTC